jgi:hypothetical protein
MSTNPVTEPETSAAEQRPEVVDGVLLRRFDVPAQPGGLWTLVVEDLTRYVRIKVRVREDLHWRYASDDRMCTAAGSRTPGVGCLCATAAVGALIGKFGGSDVDDSSAAPISAGSSASPTDQANAQLAALAAASSVAPSSGSGAFNVFPVGTYCVVAVPAGFVGPLFLTMNDKPAAFGCHAGALEAEIWGVRSQREGG